METKNFVKLDFFTIKPYFKSMMFLPAVALFIGLISKNLYFTVIMLIGYTWIISIYPFSIGEKFNMNVMYSALPGTRNQMVKARYIFFAILYWIVAAAGVLIGYIAHIITGFDFDIWQSIMIVIMIFPFICLMCSLFYCLTFKFGYLKSRFVNIIPVVLMYAGGQSLSVLFQNNIANIQQISPVIIISISILLGILILYIAMLISQRIYAKKEF